MRLIVSGLAAVSLLSMSAGCKKEAPAADPAAAPAAAAPAGDKPAEPAVAAADPAGNAAAPADPVAVAAPAVVDAGPPPAGFNEALVEGGIKTMEEFSTILSTNAADCEAAAAALKPFIEKNGEAMLAFNKSMEAAGPEVQKFVQTKYTDRMMKVMGPIMETSMKCQENEAFKSVMASMSPKAEGAADGEAPAAAE